MKKRIDVIIIAIVTAMCLALAVYGIIGIHEDLATKPLTPAAASAEPNEDSLVREVLAWYYEDGTVEDEQGQLWYFDYAQEEGQVWRLWIDDNGTPQNPTDDRIIDYVGG